MCGTVVYGAEGCAAAALTPEVKGMPDAWCEEVCDSVADAGDCSSTPLFIEMIGEKIAAVSQDNRKASTSFRQLGGANVACRWTPKRDNYVDHWYTDQEAILLGVAGTSDETGRLRCEQLCLERTVCHAYEYHVDSTSTGRCELWNIGPVFASGPDQNASFQGFTCWAREDHGAIKSAKVIGCKISNTSMLMYLVGATVALGMLLVFYCRFQQRRSAPAVVVQSGSTAVHIKGVPGMTAVAAGGGDESLHRVAAVAASQQHDELGSLLEAGQVDAAGAPSAPLGPNLDITDLQAHEFGRPAGGDVDDDGVRTATATE
eukprot:SAG25_NODE_121_length_14652_cov_9.937607_1_plen_317_part_00